MAPEEAAVAPEVAPHVAGEPDPAPLEATVDCAWNVWPQDPVSAVPFWSVSGRSGHLGHHVEPLLANQAVPEVVPQVAAAAALDHMALDEEPAVQEVPVEEAQEGPPEVVVVASLAAALEAPPAQELSPLEATTRHA